MRHLKKFLRFAFITVFFLSPITPGLCQGTSDEDQLCVYTKNTNEAAVYTLDEIKKITFGKTGIQIWNTNWPTEYSYSNVRVLTLNSKGLPSKILPTNGDYQDIIISYNAGDGILQVSGIKSNAHLAVYNTKGLMVVSEILSSGTYRLNTSHIPKGIYIVRVHSEGKSTSKKIMK